MDVSRGTAYGLGLSQFAITLGVVLFMPAVHVDVYVPSAQLTNTTDRLVVRAQGARLHMGMPVLGGSLLAAIFATVTCKAQEQGLMGQDYQPDVVQQMGMWDLIFWAFCLWVHGVVAVIVCDPMDVFGAISSTIFMAYFLYRACAPKGQMLNLTQENLNILGYCLGVLQVGYQLSDTRENGPTVLGLVIAVDYFLGIGHTYDREALIETVSNCRLFYICAGSLGTALLYGMSGNSSFPGG